MNEKELAKNLAKELEPFVKDIQKDYVKAVCEELLPEVMKKTLLTLGIDATKPIERQADFKYLNNQRIQDSDIKKRAIGELVRFSLGGVFAYIVIAWKFTLGKQ